MRYPVWGIYLLGSGGDMGQRNQRYTQHAGAILEAALQKLSEGRKEYLYEFFCNKLTIDGGNKTGDAKAREQYQYGFAQYIYFTESYPTQGMSSDFENFLKKNNVDLTKLDALQQEWLEQQKPLDKWEDKAVTDFFTNNKSRFLADEFLPAPVIANKNPIFIDIAQGVGTYENNPLAMNPVTGAIKNNNRISKTITEVYGYLSGKGEAQNIAYFMNLLQSAEKKNELPARIVLSGHSRGACSCIALAREIYLQFGLQIKIAINITDPVPGLGSFAASKMAIPPIVDSLQICYAGKESLSILKPQDLNQLYFDPARTTVTSIVLPTTHSMSQSTIPGELMQNLWQALCKETITISLQEKRKLNEEPVKLYHPTMPIVRQRQHYRLQAATDPAYNKQLPADLKEFHATLQAAAEVTAYRMQERLYVTSQVANLPQQTKAEREKLLDTLFIAGKDALKLSSNAQVPKKRDDFLKQLQAIGEKYLTAHPTMGSIFKSQLAATVLKELNTSNLTSSAEYDKLLEKIISFCQQSTSRKMNKAVINLFKQHANFSAGTEKSFLHEVALQRYIIHFTQSKNNTSEKSSTKKLISVLCPDSVKFSQTTVESSPASSNSQNETPSAGVPAEVNNQQEETLIVSRSLRK